MYYGRLALLAAILINTSFARALEVKREVFVDDDEIFLSDLIVPGTLAEDSLQSLRSVSMGSSPNESDVVVLTQHQISERLRTFISQHTGDYLPLLLERTPLKIPSEVRVHRLAPLFNETHFQEQLLETLRLDCPECRFEITRVRMPPARPGYEGYSWHVNTQNQRIRGPFSVRVDFREGTQILASEYVSGEVRIFRNVAVLNKSIPLGERVQPEDFQFKSVDTTFWSDSPLAATELAGVKTKRALRARDPIQRQDIERERLVQRGEMVEVHVAQPGIEISMTGIAQDAGMMGDIVHILNTGSKRQVNGVVVAKGIVELK